MLWLDLKIISTYLTIEQSWKRLRIKADTFRSLLALAQLFILLCLIEWYLSALSGGLSAQSEKWGARFNHVVILNWKILFNLNASLLFKVNSFVRCKLVKITIFFLVLEKKRGKEWSFIISVKIPIRESVIRKILRGSFFFRSLPLFRKTARDLEHFPNFQPRFLVKYSYRGLCS